MESEHVTVWEGEPAGVFVGVVNLRVCLWVWPLSVQRTVQSQLEQVFQLLELTPSPGQRYVLKLCDSEEFLRK